MIDQIRVFGMTTGHIGTQLLKALTQKVAVIIKPSRIKRHIDRIEMDGKAGTIDCFIELYI
ncbi:hypothetical protein D3C85_1947480 [compost metagenome]